MKIKRNMERRMKGWIQELKKNKKSHHPIPRKMKLSDFHVCLCKDFPSTQDLRMHGEERFKMPRFSEERIPLVVLPPAVSTGIKSVYGKELLGLEFESDADFRGMTEWANTLSGTDETRSNTDTDGQQILTLCETGKFYLGVRVPEHVSFLDCDGVCVKFAPWLLQSGVRVQCVVEIPVCWRKGDKHGICLQLVQCKILSGPPVCMVDPVLE